LTALTLAIGDWTGNYEVIFSLEGHGREDLEENMDISRTIGWFTTRFPVHLSINNSPNRNVSNYTMPDINLGEAIKEIKEELFSKGVNEFTFTLPKSKNTVTFKLLTHKDEQNVNRELEGLKKINKDAASEVTVRLAHIITSINGSTDKKDIREFVNNYFLAKDARAFRSYYNEISPDIDVKIILTNSEGIEEDADLPIGINFFWPDA
jgi:hypothetical protein